MNLPRLPAVDWIGKRYALFAVSGSLLALSVGAIVTRGFNYSIDFTGGTAIQLTYAGSKTLADLRADLETAGYRDAVPQSFAGSSAFIIRVKGAQAMDAIELESFLKKLQEASPGNAIRVDRKEYVGPSVGRHLRRQALLAIGLALCGIVVYVAFRFDNPVWGLAGVLALFHDVIATAGLFSLFQKEVDLVIVAALLTIAGYSINDTIVIFDRMRERLRLYRREPLGDVINNSINEMMSRTLLTNGMVIAVSGSVFLLGGAVVHDFATAMLFGGIVGTYSTVAIATPLVYEWYAMGRSGKASAPPPAPAREPQAKARSGRREA